MIDPGVIGLSSDLAVLPVEGLGWTDLGEPERVLAALKVKLESAGRLGEVAACIKPVTVTPFAHQLTNNFQYRPSMAHNQSHLKRRR
jgi:hypothetical protein